MGRWGRRWDYPERTPRPKVKKLDDDKKKEIYRNYRATNYCA